MVCQLSPARRLRLAAEVAARAAVALCCAVVVGVALSPAAGAAAGSAAPGLRPVQPGPDGYFEYSLSAGATASGEVVLTNPTGSAATYLLYAADASTSPNSGVAYGQQQSATTGAARWVVLPDGPVALAAGAKTTVPFTVTVPPGAAAGQHVAAVVAQSPSVAQPASSPGGGGVAFTTDTRVVVAVVVDVAGPAAAGVRVARPRVALQQHTRQLLSIPMANTGGLLVKPSLTGRLEPCGNSRAVPPVVLERQLDTFVPHTAISYPWYLDRALPAGCYTVDLTMRAGRTVSSFTGNIHVGPAEAAVGSAHDGLPYTVPVAFVAVDVAGLALVAAGLVHLVRIRRRRLRLG